MNENDIKSEINNISQIMKNAYVKYSDFRVGCLVISDSDNKYYGVNVENKSFGLSICAERNAITTAVTNGMKKIKTLIVVADTSNPVTPCGACREVISEFSDNETEIILANLKGDYNSYKIDEILPLRFSFDEDSKFF